MQQLFFFVPSYQTKGTRRYFTRPASAILLIAGEFFFQQPLLAADAADDERWVGKHHKKGEDRPQHKRHGEEQHERGGVHRMAHDAVQAAVDHDLPLLHLDRAGEKGVFAQHLGPHEIGQQEQNSRGVNDPAGQHEPAEAEVQPRKDERDDEHHAALPDDLLLLALPLFGVEPLFKQRGIVQHHHDPGNEHRDEQKPHQQPAVRIAQRPGREKEQQPQQHDAGEIFCDRLNKKLFCHRDSPFIRRI